MDTLFYNARDPAERYSAVDTLRAQGDIYLTTGSRLLSTNGRVLATLVADTCGRHDTLGGACAAESNQVRYALEKHHAQLPRQFPAGPGAVRLRNGQAGPDQQRQFLHERAGHAGGRPDLRGRHLGGRQVRGTAGRHGRHRPDLQLPQLNNPCNAYNPTPVRLLICDGANSPPATHGAPGDGPVA